jgi:hypothetical protein
MTDQVEAPTSPFPLRADLGCGQPDLGDQRPAAQLGQHPGVDAVGLARQGGKALGFLGVGQEHVPAGELELVVDEASTVHGFDRCPDRLSEGRELTGEAAKTVRVRADSGDGQGLPVVVESADFQPCSTEVKTDVQHGSSGPPFGAGGYDHPSVWSPGEAPLHAVLRLAAHRYAAGGPCPSRQSLLRRS